MLMLVVALMLTAAVACNSDENTETPDNGGDSGGDVIETPTINKSVIFADIKNGLVNAGERVAQTTAGTRYVTSEYTLIVDNVNVNVNYDANYDISRPEDSEIMLCVYDHLNEKNTVFVYYKDKTLYYAVGDKRVLFGGFCEQHRKPFLLRRFRQHHAAQYRRKYRYHHRQRHKPRQAERYRKRLHN